MDAQFDDEGSAVQRFLNKLPEATQLITDKTEVPGLLIVCPLLFAYSTSAAQKQILWPKWTSAGSLRDGSFLP